MNNREKELKALGQCADALNNLEYESILKVFHMLTIHFDIVPNVAREFPNSVIGKTNNEHTKLIENNNSEYSDNDNIELSKINSRNILADYPSLKELLLKNYPKNEAEWILCYSFYASNFGNDSFTIEQVKEKYRENNKYSLSNQKNFATNIGKCVKNDWIKHINGDEYFIKDDGKTYAIQIMNGNSSSTERKRVVKRKTKPTL